MSEHDFNDDIAAEGVSSQPGSSAGRPVGHDGVRVEVTEIPAKRIGGVSVLLALLGAIALLALSIVVLVLGANGSGFFAVLAIIVGGFGVGALPILIFSSFVIISPGQTSVRKFFGRYIGTVRADGLSVVMPLSIGQRVSVRVRNFETNTIKVNDLDGNPITIAAIVVWQVSDTAKAVFAVDEYDEFVSTQAEAALRHVAGAHPYDDGNAEVPSLLGSTEIVSAELAHEVAERVALAGVEIVEVRISALAYAPEIAQAMLQRQQAGAIVAAREQIVEGAVSMVDDALTRLEKENIVSLDDERRAQMVSNLLVVLCSESHTTPVVNAGSLYS
ncbi:MAG: SPFH domain-containing protein [Bowdeniella nasicola]|nr:SPFH domain-containing protein [Bowdeniella nasicola]